MSSTWKHNRVLLLLRGEEIVSMLHLNPYTCIVQGERLDLHYIVGVCTKKAEQGKGYMGQLVTEALRICKEDGEPFTYLMPAAEAIYTPFQFTFIYDQPVWKLSGNKDLKRVCVEEDTVELAADWMQHWLESRYEVFAKRDAAYVKSLVREVQSELGKLELLYDGEQLVGIQGIWGREKKEQRLLYTEDGYSELEKKKPAIMARLITLENFVPVIHLKEDAETEQFTVCLELEDPLIPQNDGHFIWTLDHNGSQIEKLTGQIGTMEEALAQTEWETDRVLHLKIEELTQWLFGYRIPEAVKQYAGAEQIDVLSRIFLDEVV